MNVASIMRREPPCCAPVDSLAQAAQLLWRTGSPCVAVVDESGRLVGLIGGPEVCLATYAKSRPPTAIPVAVAMARAPRTARPDDPLDRLARLLRRERVARVAVVDRRRRPVGMVGLTELARAAADADDAELGRLVLQAVAAGGEARARTQPAEARLAALVQG